MKYEIPLPNGETRILSGTNGKNYALVIEWSSLFPKKERGFRDHWSTDGKYYISTISCKKKYIHIHQRMYYKIGKKSFFGRGKIVKFHVIDIKPVGGFTEITPTVKEKIDGDIHCIFCKSIMVQRKKDYLECKEIFKCNEESFFFCENCQTYEKLYFAEEKDEPTKVS